MSNPLSAFLEIAAAGGNLFNGKWNFSFTISPASNTNTKNISYLFMTVASIDTSKSSTPVVGSSSSYSNACAFTVEANDSCDRIRIGVPTNHSGTTYYLRIDGSGQNLIAAPFDDTASWLQVKDAGNGYFSLQSATGAWIYYNSSTHNFAVSGGSLAPGHFMAIKYGAVANTTLGDLAIGEVAFYVDTNYGGSQSTGKVYVFSTPVSDTSLISGMKDSISSVKTGPTTAVALFSDSQFSGKMSITDTNQPNLTKLSVGGDSLSSFEIWPLAAPTLELASGEAILYSLPNFQGLPRLLTSSQNIYSGSGQSLRVGPQTMITAYAGNNLTGNAITWFADINNLADDNAASPVKNCPASIKLTDLNQYFSGTGAINGVAELHQYP
ncbi:MAG: hypothetical protein JNM52_01450, partial [Betaproteobacteria bacterium]|nr:hypothetical protein [Betaproteobacteria bacterium]